MRIFPLQRGLLGQTLLAVAAALSCAALLAVGDARAVDAMQPTAHSAGETYAKDRTYLHLIGSPGLEITEEGTSYGTFGGSSSSHLTISGSHITGTFVFHARGGVVRGRTSASVVGKAALPVVSFAGSITIASGTGHYARASGQMHLTGSIRRKNYEIYEETTGNVRL
jgi:hypothetical protein